MRLNCCLLFMLLLSISLSVAAEVREQSYYFYALGKSKPAYDYRVNSFAAFFGDSLFGENKDAMYLFYEHNGIQRLFIFGSNDSDEIAVFQLPETKVVPWLHPERYMEKRDSLQKTEISRNKCMNLGIDGNLILPKLDSLQLDLHLYVVPRFRDEGMSIIKTGNNKNHRILGFSQKAGKRQYFYYIKYEDFWEQQPEYFAVYGEVFKIVETLSGSIVFPECR